MPCVDEEIIATKFLLYCFEELSGIKINYHKSEVFSVGISKLEEERIAMILNCNIGSFPFKYLGLPMSPFKLRVADLEFIPQKLENRLNLWQAGSLYYSGRAVLINACLSSIPSYAMGLFLLPESIHNRLDSIRGRFYWEGVNDKRRYHMVKWCNLAFPKNFGGLGFTETRAMNSSLLAKWIFKLESNDSSLCMMVLRNKYMSNSGFFQGHARGKMFSFFWKGLHSIKAWVLRGATEVGIGNHIYFWRDVWLNSVSLKTLYPFLYEICNQKEILVKDVLEEGLQILTFRRAFSITDFAQWNELCALIDNLNILSQERAEDNLVWALDNKGVFSSNSLYNLITFRGVIDVNMQNLWSSPIPLKLKHFLWLAWRDKIQST
uniref:Reverse transcriptase zinc-binding domain-containing protein n=1 Tax=Oryza brachyantha TaxID=4533 RepID=J3MDK7_ORYBR